jgi:hypothetical protein
MKRYGIVFFLVLAGGLAGSASADSITDAQVQNMRNFAQMAYDKADIADASRNHVAAANWRQQAHYYERQAEALRSQRETLDRLSTAIRHAVE